MARDYHQDRGRGYDYDRGARSDYDRDFGYGSRSGTWGGDRGNWGQSSGPYGADRYSTEGYSRQYGWGDRGRFVPEQPRGLVGVPDATDVVQQRRVVGRLHLALREVERASQAGGQDTGTQRRTRRKSEAQVGEPRQACKQVSQPHGDHRFSLGTRPAGGGIFSLAHGPLGPT